MNRIRNKQIAALYREMFVKLLVYARSSLKSDALAEEAVQETFLIACRKPQALLDSPNPRGWLILTLKNTIRNMKYARERDQKLIERYLRECAQTVFLESDSMPLHVVYGDLAQTEEFKLLWELTVQGKSCAELAQERGITVAACKKRIERAKKFLQKKFEN